MKDELDEPQPIPEFSDLLVFAESKPEKYGICFFDRIRIRERAKKDESSLIGLNLAPHRGISDEQYVYDFLQREDIYIFEREKRNVSDVGESVPFATSIKFIIEKPKKLDGVNLWTVYLQAYDYLVEQYAIDGYENIIASRITKKFSGNCMEFDFIPLVVAKPKLQNSGFKYKLYSNGIAPNAKKEESIQKKISEYISKHLRTNIEISLKSVCMYKGNEGESIMYNPNNSDAETDVAKIADDNTLFIPNLPEELPRGTKWAMEYKLEDVKAYIRHLSNIPKKTYKQKIDIISWKIAKVILEGEQEKEKEKKRLEREEKIADKHMLRMLKSKKIKNKISLQRLFDFAEAHGYEFG